MSSPEKIITQLPDQVVRREHLETVATLGSQQQHIISGFRQKVIHLRLNFTILRIVIKGYSNPLDWIRAFRYLIRLRKGFLGHSKLTKMVVSGGDYYVGLYIPGWKTQFYTTFMASQLNDFKPIKNLPLNRFNTVFIAMTKKCPLQCEHCFEWDNLNQEEVLTPKMLKGIVDKLQDQGVCQIHFTGGEPLIKMGTLVDIITYAHRKSELWVTTSGYKLNATNAQRLKEAGLTGIIISLDHFIPEKHNAFRNFKDSYYWVEEAVKNAIENNLVTSLSLCATKEFISEKNLMDYMELAKKLNVSFVQLLEPKAVGHYANKDVLLTPDHMNTLEAFFVKMNSNSDYKSYPIITYHGYYLRRLGCFNAGLKGMYIDTDGDINPCPFCHKKKGNVLDDHFMENLSALKSEGCSGFKIYDKTFQ